MGEGMGNCKGVGYLQRNSDHSIHCNAKSCPTHHWQQHYALRFPYTAGKMIDHGLQAPCPGSTMNEQARVAQSASPACDVFKLPGHHANTSCLANKPSR